MAIKFNEKNISLASCIAYALLIFIGSSIPGKEFPDLSITNYQLHFVAFFFFGVLLLWWMSSARNCTPAMAIFQAASIGSIYGIFDELHQHFTPGRTVDPFDWLSDSLGAIAGAGCAMFLLFLLKRYGSTRDPQQDL